jgi:hypothetical protein
MRDANNIWPRFTEVLARKTVVDPKPLERGSSLFKYRLFWVQIENASVAVCIAIGTIVGRTSMDRTLGCWARNQG